MCNAVLIEITRSVVDARLVVAGGYFPCEDYEQKERAAGVSKNITRKYPRSLRVKY